MGFLSKIFVKAGHKDPVCGMNAANKITAEHNGQTYFFCSEHCKAEFERDPEKYAQK